MLSWVLIGAILVLVFIFFKVGSVRQNFTTFIVFGLLFFFLITVSYVASKANASFSTFDGLTSLLKFYFSWLGQVTQNLFSISGNAVKMDWGVNFSNFTR